MLPALARLLKTDLNTLLCFQDDYTEVEIDHFVEEVDRTVRKQGIEVAFQQAIDKIHEYPTCEKLIHSVVLYLEGALALYSVPDADLWRTKLEPYYNRLAASDIPEIRDTAMSMLISYARNRGDFSKAEELIRCLPPSVMDKEEQLAILYQRQGCYSEAGKIWEHRIFQGVIEIQTALINMLESALQENREKDAAFFAEMYQTLTRQFCFPEWMSYNAELQLALAKKDSGRSRTALEKCCQP